MLVLGYKIRTPFPTHKQNPSVEIAKQDISQESKCLILLLANPDSEYMFL